MNHSTKDIPQVKIVKRAHQYKRSVFYILVTNCYNDDNSILLKIFPQYEIGNSNKASILN